MAYCTADEVIGMLKTGMIGYIVGADDEDSGGDYTAESLREAVRPLAENAVEDAQAEIDGYLAKRYDVPFAKTPKVIRKFAKDIALYNLVSRKGVDEGDREKTYLTRYNAAIAFLTKAAEGKIDIGVEDIHTTQSAAQNGFSMKSENRIFSRNSMRGW